MNTNIPEFFIAYKYVYKFYLLAQVLRMILTQNVTWKSEIICEVTVPQLWLCQWCKRRLLTLDWLPISCKIKLLSTNTNEGGRCWTLWKVGFIRQDSINHFWHSENQGVNKSFILWTIKFFGQENYLKYLKSNSVSLSRTENVITLQQHPCSSATSLK